MQFVRHLLAKQNTVHATARKPAESQGLQELGKNKELSVDSVDTADFGSVKSWTQKLKGSRPFEVIPEPAVICMHPS